MHELSLCQNMLKVIEEQSVTQPFRRVKTVWLEVGALAGVEIEALKFGFDVAMKGSMAEGAQLEIISVAAEGVCDQCGEQVKMQQRFDACPSCGSLSVKLLAGDGLRVKELEVV